MRNIRSTYLPIWPSGTNLTNWTETWSKLLENNYLGSPVFVSKMLTSQPATYRFYRYLFGVTYILNQTIGSKSLWSQIIFGQNLEGQITPGSADTESIRSYYSNDQSKLYQGNWFSYLIIIAEAIAYIQ